MRPSTLTVTTVLALALNICAPLQAASTDLPAAVAEDTAFMSWMNSLVEAAGNDSEYRRIPLNTPEQVNAFAERLHRLYRGRTSEAEFRAWVNERYPGHTYEQDFIIQYLARHGHGNR